MVSKFIFLIAIFVASITTLEAANLLKRVSVDGSTLALEFKESLKNGSFKASAIKKKGITKYFFDFKDCYLDRKVKRVLKLKGNVKSVRVGQYKKSIVRVVIDSKKSYKVNYHQKDKPIFYISLPTKSSVIVKKSTKKSVKKNIKKSTKKSSNKSSAKELFSFVNNDIDTSIKLVETPYSANLKHSYTIMLDPGHGGKKPGTMWAGLKEKDLVLQISKRVYRRLKNLGFKVKMTRYRDKHISLRNRIKKANKAKADLFVSIHANSTPNKNRIYKAYGVETYFLQTTRNAKAKRVAAKENADLLKSMDSTTKQVLLNTVFTGSKIQLSNRLAIDVQREILGSLKSAYKGIKGNGVRGAPFYVLVGAQMPAILVEVGYMSNPKERKRLYIANYQERIAIGIVKGIINYLKIRERELE
jgi:N-acetylmuramoyl-L-alanine amidase